MQHNCYAGTIAANAQGQKKCGINAWIGGDDLSVGAGAGYLAEHKYYCFMPNLLAACRVGLRRSYGWAWPQ